MVCITSNPGDYDICRENLDFLPGIYMNVVMEDQCRATFNNHRNQDDEVNSVQVNSAKNTARIIKLGISFENIILTVKTFQCDTGTTKKSTESSLQGIIILSHETLEDTFFHLVGYISELTYLKKWAVILDIVQRWGLCITEEG